MNTTNMNSQLYEVRRVTRVPDPARKIGIMRFEVVQRGLTLPEAKKLVRADLSLQIFPDKTTKVKAGEATP